MTFGTATLTPNEYDARFTATTNPSYTQAQAKNWNLYTLVWESNYVAWYINGVLYNHQAGTTQYPTPWRCASFRYILRTDGGLATPATDDHVYVQYMAYTPSTTSHLFSRKHP